jgi:hypothetical protein
LEQTRKSPEVADQEEEGGGLGLGRGAGRSRTRKKSAEVAKLLFVSSVELQLVSSVDGR